MLTSLKITTINLVPKESDGKVLDFKGSCAFAICTKGDMEIKILNEYHKVSVNCMFACMPFVNIHVLHVTQPTEIIFGSIQIKDFPRLINHWVNMSNLSSVHSNPLIKLSDIEIDQLLSVIVDYQNEHSANENGVYSNICNKIQTDIFELYSRLILGKVVKIYFNHMSMEPRGFMPRDLEYQQFMLALYTNFREHREVKFYAMRSGVSEKYFSTLIRELSGSTPSEWIETVVVGEAKTMLSDHQHSIKEIASSLNFPDAPTFTKYFQRVTGMTPKAYRKSL